MMVGGQGFVDLIFVHQQETDCIAKRPVFILSFSEEVNRILRKSVINPNDLDMNP